MERLTGRNADGYFVDEGKLEEAILRLGKFEDAHQDLTDRQAQIPKLLAELRAQGKEKTVTYRELMARKLIDNNIVQFLKEHGLS